MKKTSDCEIATPAATAASRGGAIGFFTQSCHVDLTPVSQEKARRDK